MEENGSITKGFEPARYLTKVSGSDYLEVRWRLVWMRDRHPDAELNTELVELTENRAVFKATIVLPAGGSATGYGSESSGDFRDFIEKAETKAIGRACSALGFGTQFTPDHDFAGMSGRVVDSPVGRRQEAAADLDRRATASVSAIGPDQPATQRQLRYLQAVAREAGLDSAALDEKSEQEFGVSSAELTRRDASTLIDLIQSAPVTS